MLRLLPTTILPLISLGILLFAVIGSHPVWTGSVFLFHITVLPLLLWFRGRVLRVRFRDDPPSRSDVLLVAGPTAFAALGVATNMLAMLLWLVIAVIPYVGLWIALGLHRRDAPLV